MNEGPGEDCKSRTLSLLLLLACFAFIGIAFCEMAIGIKYLLNCPASEQIPIYLIASGVVTILSNVFLVYFAFKLRIKASIGSLQMIFATIAGLISFGMFITGNVWVHTLIFSRKEHDVDPYCHPILYDFTYFSLIIKGVFGGLVGVLIIITIWFRWITIESAENMECCNRYD